MAYAASILKKASWVTDVQQHTRDQLQPGATGEGVWDWVRSFIHNYQDTPLVRSIIQRVARGKLERQLFDPEFYKKFRKKDSFLGRLALRTGWGIDDAQEALYAQHKGLIDAIDTSTWGDTPAAGRVAFNKSFASNPELAAQLNASARKVFSSWGKSEPTLS